MPSFQALSDNSRGIVFMLAAVTAFIFSDTCVKLASDELSIAQIIVVRSLIACPFVVLLGLRQRAFRNMRAMAERFMALRVLGEVAATALFLTALAHMEIANATAVLQIVPLATTAAGALFLGEKVGMRRWSAIFIGFLAVLLIIRPGLEGFTGWSLLALASTGFIVLKDLSSRLLPLSTHPLAVSAWSIVAMVPLGFAMLPFEYWAPLTLRGTLLCAVAALFLSLGFVLITYAMRHGELAVVQPFRYAILLWAVLIQIVVFSAWPDSLTLLGGAILVATGLYTLYREARRKRESVTLRHPIPVPSAE